MSGQPQAPKPSSNIEFNALPGVSWEPGQRRESLQRMADYVAGEAASAIDWYLRKKTGKQWPAKILRSLAIGATALAGLIPMLATIFTDQGVPRIAPAWASVALLVAATCVGLDRFFGYSSGWMRFLTTEMQIRHALHDFLLDWETRRAGWEGQDDPGAQEAEAGLQHCKRFMSEVNDILKAEMDTWVTEFRTAVADIDKAAKAQALILQLAAANITVTNGEQCQDGWQLSVDGGAPRAHRGTSSALRNLVPGSHVVTVTGRIGAQDRRAEMAFTVAAGATAAVNLTLA